MTCPSCGAGMFLKPDVDSFVCDYYQSVYIPQPSADGVRVPGRVGIPGLSGEDALLRSLPRHADRDGRFCGLSPGSSGQPRHAGRYAAGPEGPPAAHQLPTVRQGDGHLSLPRPGIVVIIDDCECCEVNWLDDGELQRIVQVPDHHSGG